MNRRHAPLALLLIAAALALTALTGCAGTTTTTVRTPASAPAASAAAAGSPSSAAGSPSTAAGSPSASAAPCTTHACIAQDAQGLIGGVAKDESVMTALSCQESTVKHLGPGIWSVRCLATYSDGAQWDGIATVLLSSSQVTWEPTQQVS